jgi:hypothetical protein
MSHHHGRTNKKTNISARDCAQVVNKEIRDAPPAFRVHAKAKQG